MFEDPALRMETKKNLAMPEPGDDRSRPWEDQRPWKGHFPNLGRGGFNYWLRPPDPYCLELAPTQVASTPAIPFHTGPYGVPATTISCLDRTM